MRYLSLSEVLFLHQRIVATSGGSLGVRNLPALEAAVNQPRITFDQKELYPDLASKAASLGYSLVLNHPFIDGNKRVGHAAMKSGPPSMNRKELSSIWPPVQRLGRTSQHGFAIT